MITDAPSRASRVAVDRPMLGSRDEPVTMATLPRKRSPAAPVSIAERYKQSNRRRGVPVDDYPVKVGSMLFTMVDPHRGHEVAYNRWYERDHFYAGCLIGPWLFAGGRWVATRALKDLRFPADSPFADPVDAGSYLSIYWVHEGHEGEHSAWATKQVRWLYGNGRGFDERTHAHTALYSLVARHDRDAGGVPLELALDHGYDGLAVVAIEPSDGVTRDELVARLSTEAVPALFEGDRDSGVALGSTWRVMPMGGQSEDAPPAPM